MSGVLVHKKFYALIKNIIHPKLQIAAALRIMVYGSAANAQNEHLQISDYIVLLWIKLSRQNIFLESEKRLFRALAEVDWKQIMKMNAAIGSSEYTKALTVWITSKRTVKMGGPF